MIIIHLIPSSIKYEIWPKFYKEINSWWYHNLHTRDTIMMISIMFVHVSDDRQRPRAGGAGGGGDQADRQLPLRGHRHPHLLRPGGVSQHDRHRWVLPVLHRMNEGMALYDYQTFKLFKLRAQKFLRLILSKLRQKGWANNNKIIQSPVQCAQSAARGTVQMWQMWLNKRANTVSIPNLHTRWNDNQSIAVYLPWKCYCAIVLSLQWRQFNLSNVLQCWSLAGAGPDYDPVYLQISTDRDNPIALTSEPASDMNFYNPRYSLHLTI